MSKGKTGYMVIYKHNGYELSAGNPVVFPVRELAEKYLRNYASRPWFNDELYIVECDYQGEELKPCRTYNGRQVLNEDWDFGIDAMEVGDYVEREVVEEYIYCMPPACMRSDCSQLGEPETERYDEVSGKWRNTYETFKRVADDVWEYCGDCFRGENIKRGKEHEYV